MAADHLMWARRKPMGKLIRNVEISRAAANAAAAVCCLLLLAVFGGLARRASLHKSATFDEPASLVSAWMQTHYSDFRVEMENPPLYKHFIAADTRAGDLRINLQSLALSAPPQSPDGDNSFFVDTLYRAPGVNADRLLNSARARMIWLGVALGAVIAWWAWRLAGSVAAVVAGGGGRL